MDRWKELLYIFIFLLLPGKGWEDRNGEWDGVGFLDAERGVVVLGGRILYYGLVVVLD